MLSKGLQKLYLADLLFGWLALNTGFIVAVALRFNDLKVENPTYYNYYVQLWIFCNLVYLILKNQSLNSKNLRLYDGIRMRLNGSIRLITTHAFSLALLLLILKGTFFSRLFGLYYYVLWIGLQFTWDIISLNLYRKSWLSGKGLQKIVLIGEGRMFEFVIEQHLALRKEGLELAACFGSKEIVSDWNGPYFEIQEAKSFILKNPEIQMIYIAFNNFKTILDWQRFGDENMITIRLVPEVHLPFHLPFKVEFIGNIPIIFPRKEPLENNFNRIIKRSFDLVFTISFGISLLPITILILLIMMKLSGQKILFFKQLRSGLRGRSFVIYKLRTLNNDGTPTIFGHWLRRHSLDELPQFINVLKGQMSIIGPRPHMPEHTNLYKQQIDAFMVRHLIKPGITGLAQIQGLRGGIGNVNEMKDRVNADVYYLSNWSFILDLKILFYTIWQVIFPSKANKF